MSPPSWAEIWAARTLSEAAEGGSLLRRLMDADGLDSGFARVEEEPWRAFSLKMARTLRLREGDGVFDVGCGAGAFLQPLHEIGHPVGGIDWSASLIDIARGAGLGDDLTVQEAVALDPEPPWDVVVAASVFLYFESEAYAEAVLDRMVRKARRAVALFDLPDAARRAEAMAERERVAGGAARYAERYAGLDHRFYDRDWVAAALRARGLVDVHVEDQSIEGYGNTPYRFNAWGFVPEAA